MEDNNPFLFITLPEHLRANPTLRAQLNANREHLITHFDIYATLHQIANVKFRDSVAENDHFLGVGRSKMDKRDRFLGFSL